MMAISWSYFICRPSDTPSGRQRFSLFWVLSIENEVLITDWGIVWENFYCCGNCRHVIDLIWALHFERSVGTYRYHCGNCRPMIVHRFWAKCGNTPLSLRQLLSNLSSCAGDQYLFLTKYWLRYFFGLILFILTWTRRSGNPNGSKFSATTMIRRWTATTGTINTRRHKRHPGWAICIFDNRV